MTNREKIMTMSDDDLGGVLMCPYDDAAEFVEACGYQCSEGPEKATYTECKNCISAWLKKEAK